MTMHPPGWVDGRTTRPKTPAMPRLLAKCVAIPFSGCLVWMGGTVGQGYGRIKQGDTRYLTHRLVYESVHGPIPEGMVVLHECDVPSCCNPDHLRVGTQQENVEDMASKGRHGQQRRTHCGRGHELTPDNIVVYSGARCCRTCKLGRKAT